MRGGFRHGRYRHQGPPEHLCLHGREDTPLVYRETNRKLGLGTALAGALKFEDIDALKRIDPEIIGVRGMVCGGDRNATVREDLIKTALAMIR